MGVDSVAILTRWIHEPACRDFDLADLVVLTAMTGDEFDATRALMDIGKCGYWKVRKPRTPGAAPWSDRPYWPVSRRSPALICATPAPR